MYNNHILSSTLETNIIFNSDSKFCRNVTKIIVTYVTLTTRDSTKKECVKLTKFSKNNTLQCEKLHIVSSQQARKDQTFARPSWKNVSSRVNPYLRLTRTAEDHETFTTRSVSRLRQRVIPSIVKRLTQRSARLKALRSRRHRFACCRLISQTHRRDLRYGQRVREEKNPCKTRGKRNDDV